MRYATTPMIKTYTDNFTLINLLSAGGEEQSKVTLQSDNIRYTSIFRAKKLLDLLADILVGGHAYLHDKVLNTDKLQGHKWMVVMVEAKMDARQKFWDAYRYCLANKSDVHYSWQCSHLNVRHPLEQGFQQLWPEQFLSQDDQGAQDLTRS